MDRVKIYLKNIEDLSNVMIINILSYKYKNIAAFLIYK